MISQLVTWVALPNGASADGTERRLSLFVSPRLLTDQAITLAPFVDFLDWPARVTDPATTISIELADGAVIPATLERDPPDSACHICPIRSPRAQSSSACRVNRLASLSSWSSTA